MQQGIIFTKVYRHSANSKEHIAMLSMKGLCALISLFSCFFCLTSSQTVNCPAGAPSGCKCKKVWDNLEVKCKDETGIKNIPSWIPNNTAELEFQGCRILFLNQDSFKNLVNLTGIKIQKQYRHSFMFNDSLVFQGLKRLHSVEFQDIGITSLPAGLFANLPSLGTVGLSDNPIITLPNDLLENSTNVQTIRLANTQLNIDVIAKIGEGHFGKKIQSLSIYGTKIQVLKDRIFGGLPKLDFIEITNCAIEYINADIFKGTKVEYIELDENPIKSIGENAFQDSKITTFSCNNCQLTSDMIFSGFLKKMPVSLEAILLKNNKLTHVPKNAFTGLAGLFVINLSNNKIATIEDNPFANLPKCKDVFCLRLQNNPFNCDCNLAWLRSFADKIEGDKSQWKCSKPQSVSGKSLVSLNVDQFCCESGNMTKCRTTDSGWIISAHILVAILSQILVMHGILSLFASH